MGLFDKIGGAIGGALEGLGNLGGQLIEGIAPIASQALGARLAEKLGPRGAMPGTVASIDPRIIAQIPRQQVFGGAVPSASSVFNPGGLGRLAGADMAQNPFGSGPFLPQTAGFQTANMLGPVVRQLPGLLGGLAAGEAVETLFAGRAMSAKMPGGITVNSLFRQTPSGRMSPSRVAFMEDGQGGGAFFVNAGVPKTWSKVTMKKRRACHPR